MSDQTIPIGGGWVMITRPLPTQIRPPVLSVWYAMPAKVFVKGSRHVTAFGGRLHHPYTDSELNMAWRKRRNAKFDDMAEEEWEKAVARSRRNEWIGRETLDEIELEQQVKILTPWGSVHVQPEEWSPVSDISLYLDFVNGEDVVLHELGGMENASKLNDQIFYIMSRGISKADAYRMIMGTVDRPNLIWLEFHQEYARYFGLAA